VVSFKIEGRMKSAYYAAVTANAYRMAIDAYERDPEGYTFDPAWLDEVESVSHREYGTGFYFDDPMQNPQLVSACGYLREKAYFSTATEYVEEEADLLRAADAVQPFLEGVHGLGGRPQSRQHRQRHKRRGGRVDILQDLVDDREQIFRQQVVHRVEQGLLAHRGEFHQPQEQHQKRKYGHQNKEGRLRRGRTDLIIHPF
jgi:hypothetical protein